MVPTYQVTAIEGALKPAQKALLAKEITRVHREVTGAPGFFAQVIFQFVKPGDWFMGGAPMTHDHIFVHGHIRAGRGVVDKHKLITHMAEAVRKASGWPSTGVWVYVSELIPRQMIEFGYILPEAGDELQWTANLPEADRAFMQAIGI
jgi:phenylpyruvate tautomerase PptA (4-oxalocrotonate tautomerase family)